jgi:1-acyl-sn-glycerol-3-phosphate acyltransferase
MWYPLVKPFFTLWTWAQFRLRIEGGEHIPQKGPVLVLCNHASAVDPAIAGLALGRPARYMAKEELLYVPVLGTLLRWIGTFPVRRGIADRKAIRTALEALSRGQFVLMYPEGTRSPDGRLQPAEHGAALLALRSGAPVLPMAIVGSHRVMPKGAKLPRSSPVIVRYGPLIPVPKIEGRIDRHQLDDWGARFMTAIAALLPSDQRPAADGRGSDPALAAPAAREALPPNAGRSPSAERRRG